MLVYNTLKVIHVVSSALLFGTGIGTAVYMFMAHQQQNLALRAKAYTQVVFADWLYTTSSGVIQAVTGFIMIYIRGYTLHQSSYQWHTLWVQGSVLGYIIAALCWFPVVYLQTSMCKMVTHAAQNHTKLPHRYHQYFRLWFILGIPAFASLLVVFYLMSNRPLTW